MTSLLLFFTFYWALLIKYISPKACEVEKKAPEPTGQSIVERQRYLYGEFDKRNTTSDSLDQTTS